MKNVTISLPEGVLEALRERARAEKKSLNSWLRELLSKEARQQGDWSATFLSLSEELAVPTTDRTWSREETYGERLR